MWESHSVRTLVLIVVVDCSSPSDVPSVITCRRERKSRQALVNVSGHPAASLRCSSTLHRRWECDAVRCDSCRRWGRHLSADCPSPGTWAIRTVSEVAVGGELVGEDVVGAPTGHFLIAVRWRRRRDTRFRQPFPRGLLRQRRGVRRFRLNTCRRLQYGCRCRWHTTPPSVDLWRHLVEKPSCRHFVPPQDTWMTF